jgi:hypothetical protein
MKRPRPQFRAQDYSQWLSNPGGRGSTRKTPTGQEATNGDEIDRRQAAVVADAQQHGATVVPTSRLQQPAEQELRVGGRTVQVVRVGKGGTGRAARKAEMAGMASRRNQW